jgi:hypothetical protein
VHGRRTQIERILDQGGTRGHRRGSVDIAPGGPGVAQESAERTAHKSEVDAPPLPLPRSVAGSDTGFRQGVVHTLRPAVYEPVQDRIEKDPAGWMTIKTAADGEAGTAFAREWTKTKRVRHLPVSDRLPGWVAEHVPRDARLTQKFLCPSPTGVMWSHGYQSDSSSKRTRPVHPSPLSGGRDLTPVAP